MSNTFTKDPDAVLDYTVDWTDWLGDDTISSVTWTITPDDTLAGIQEDTVLSSADAVSATIGLTGGTADRDYIVGCHIVTGDNREDERSFTVLVRER